MSNIGRYPIAGVIGSGGFGTVYLGTDHVDGARVAVKVLDRGSTGDPAFLERLHREAAAMRRVDDMHCVRVRDVVVEADVAAIVTDFVDGASLRALLGRYGRLTGPQALEILRGALFGLVAVHRAGLLHSDIKPDNIIVDRAGVSRLIDFGLAAAPPAVGMRPGVLTGSPGYLSPEQILGEPGDVRSDVYSCGVMLFELLCGRRPYGGADLQAVLAAHVGAPVPDPRAVDPSISPAFASLCMRALAKDRAMRPASAAEFLAELEQAARQQYGAAWRKGVGLGALVGGLGGALGAVGGLAPVGGAPPVPGPPAIARPARLAVRAGRRVSARVVAAAGGVTVAGAAVVAVVLANSGNATHSTPPAADTGRLLATTAHGRDLLNSTGRVVGVVKPPDRLCCYLAVLSPDSSRVILAEENALLVGPVGGTPRLLVPMPSGRAGAIAWSPDGTKVAYSTLDQRTPVPSSDVDVVNADGTGNHVLAHGSNVHSMAWSPDGSQLAFLQNQGGIWIVPTAGGRVRQILSAALPMLPAWVSWSPGSTLLFNEDGAAPSGVWQVLPDGSGLHAVLPNAASPSWSPDGTQFAAILAGHVVIADLSGRVVRRLPQAGVSSVQWSGSG